ncbi:MAG: serpin family protein [Blautia sp.]|nr:serpin family protein [Blautia sp.]
MKKLQSGKKGFGILLVALIASLMLEAQVFAAGSVPVAVADTSVKLLREALRTGKTDENILISPDSILTAMAMAENGAAGATLKEMEAALGNVPATQLGSFLSSLHQRLSGSSAFTYRPANSIWYKKGSVTLKKAYLNKMKQNFQADIYAAPFDATTVKKINNWVSEKTNGKIPSIINRLNSMDLVVLVNAVYFKGAWAEPFMTSTKRAFTKASGQKQKVEMMSGEENNFVSINGAKGFVKTYRGGKIAFMALLPPKGTSVKEYVSKLTGEALIKGYKNKATKNVVVKTRMPEFSYDYSASMLTSLKKLGIKKAFSNNADFSKMSKTGMRIDDVIHKAHIEVNKEGTEAAAATVVIYPATSVGPNPDEVVKTVYLNRPFVYALIDVKTGTPLFIGAVNSI